jgi:hypothetical protein
MNKPHIFLFILDTYTISTKSIMNLHSPKRLLVVLLFLLSANALHAQPWQKLTPREAHQIPSNTGVLIPFPLAQIPIGANYHVRATGVCVTSNQGDSADAMYYFYKTAGSWIAPNDLFPKAGLRIVYDGSTEAWFQPPTVVPYLSGQQKNHLYDATVLSRGAALSFRIFDRTDPPSSYYSDNHDSILVEVSQRSPAIAIKSDTLDFGTVGFIYSKSLTDSTEAFGEDALKVDSIRIVGAPEFTFTGSHGIGPFTLTEYQTDQLSVSFAPQSKGSYRADMHIYSANAQPKDRDRIIVLLGDGRGAKILSSPDTLDFGIVRVGANASLNEAIKNVGDSSTTLRTATVTSSTVGMSAGATPFDLFPASVSTLSITFAPLVVGKVIVRIDCALSNNTTITFYAKGQGALGVPFFSADTLDFGTLVVKDSRTLYDTLSNVGEADLLLTTFANSDPSDFTISGNQTARTMAPTAKDFYSVTFSPQTHSANGLHVGKMTVTYDGGTKDVVLIGREQLPISANLSIPRNYYAKVGEDIIVKQELNSDLTGTVTPIRKLIEELHFDPNVLRLTGVSAGSLIADPAWSVSQTPLVAGVVRVTIQSSTLALTKPGELLRIGYHVLETDKTGDTSAFPQIIVSMGSNPLEPLVSTSTGRFEVVDLCGPTHLTTTTIASFIEQNSPNPFGTASLGAVTQIRYTVGPSVNGEPTTVSITLFDQLGNKVQTLVNQVQSPGDYQVHITSSTLQSGFYSYVFTAGGTCSVRHLVVLK